MPATCPNALPYQELRQIRVSRDVALWRVGIIGDFEAITLAARTLVGAKFLILDAVTVCVHGGDQFVKRIEHVFGFGIQPALHLEHQTTQTFQEPNTGRKQTGRQTMLSLITKLYNDEAGFIVSAELILISTIGVLAMVVGLSEVASAVNQELEDVASAFGAINQSYRYSGLEGHTGSVAGSEYRDSEDFCDGDNDIVCSVATGGEGGDVDPY